MGKWLNGARVRKREIDGKDTRIAALAAAGVVTAMEHQPPGALAWRPFTAFGRKRNTSDIFSK